MGYQEHEIRDVTLLTWAAGVWEKELRGVPLQSQEASVAYCMRQHTEWRQYWNQLRTYTSENTKIVNILMHIFNDAAVKVQLDRNEPPEIMASYELMRSQGLTDMDALHVIAFVLQEQTWQSKTNGQPFDMNAYVQRVKSSVELRLEGKSIISPKP